MTTEVQNSVITHKKSIRTASAAMMPKDWIDTSGVNVVHRNAAHVVAEVMLIAVPARLNTQLMRVSRSTNTSGPSWADCL